MRHRASAWTVAAAVLVVAAVIAAAGALTATATASGGPRVVAQTLTLVPLACTANQEQAGDGCFDKPVAGQGTWSAGPTTTTWGYPDAGGSEWQVTYNYSIPQQVPAAGATISFSITATANGASSIRAQECVSRLSGFAVKESGDPCAVAYAVKPHSSASGQKQLTLLPSAGSAGESLVIDFGDGHLVHFRYEGTVAKPPQSACTLPGAARDRAARRPAARPLTARAAAINEVRAVCVQPDVQFHKGGTPADAWLPLEVGQVLKAGDEITCDPDGAVTLAFADNSTVTVSHTTQLKIGSFFTEGGVVRTEILLKMGEVAAQVNKSEATKSDFRIKPPTATISVRGTVFTVFYDPGSSRTLVATFRGLVRVAPSNRKLRAVSLGVGREVALTRTSESAVAAIGKAGARGGVNASTARDLALGAVALHIRACGATTPRTNAYSVAPARGGWLVTVRLIGRTSGVLAWRVTGRRVTPANALARKLTRGCG